MLTGTDLWFGYDARTPVVRGVTLSVASGALVGILGPNGSGKTTLLRLLSGTRAPQRGAVMLDGQPLRGLARAAIARRMAVVPQETQLAFDYTAAEVVMMGRFPHLGAMAIEGPSDLRLVEESLAATGTLRLRDRPFTQLSGGEKQRVIIAAALAQISGAPHLADTAAATAAPAILLLDEPTASLDLRYQIEVAALLTDLRIARGLTVVISTHDLSLAGSLCETLILMRDGAVVSAGAVDAVLTPENIRSVYDVEAEVLVQPSGDRLVVPRRHGAA